MCGGTGRPVLSFRSSLALSRSCRSRSTSGSACGNARSPSAHACMLIWANGYQAHKMFHSRINSSLSPCARCKPEGCSCSSPSALQASMHKPLQSSDAKISLAMP